MLGGWGSGSISKLVYHWLWRRRVLPRVPGCFTSFHWVPLHAHTQIAQSRPQSGLWDIPKWAALLIRLPSPRAFSGSFAECVPWNQGLFLPLQLMLLCSMLSEANTFTQVTFVIPVSRTLSCVRAGAVCIGREDCPFGAGSTGLEMDEDFSPLALPETDWSLDKAPNSYGLWLLLTEEIDT